MFRGILYAYLLSVCFFGEVSGGLWPIFQQVVVLLLRSKFLEYLGSDSLSEVSSAGVFLSIWLVFFLTFVFCGAEVFNFSEV